VEGPLTIDSRPLVPLVPLVEGAMLEIVEEVGNVGRWQLLEDGTSDERCPYR